MTLTEIMISAIGFIGIGGILKSFLDFIIENKKRKDDSKQQFKETRYKAIILLMHSLINYEKEKNNLLIHRPNIQSKEELSDELYAEWINMSLYASDKVILKMKEFVVNPNNTNFNCTILEMRKDLYSIKTKLKENNLNIAR
jgi:hypothetical protein